MSDVPDIGERVPRNTFEFDLEGMKEKHRPLFWMCLRGDPVWHSLSEAQQEALETGSKDVWVAGVQIVWSPKND